MLTKMTDGSLTRSQPHTGKADEKFQPISEVGHGQGHQMAFLTQLPGEHTYGHGFVQPTSKSNYQNDG